MKRLQNILLAAISFTAFACAQQPHSRSLAGNQDASAGHAILSYSDQPIMGPFLRDPKPPVSPSLSEFVRRIHEDKSGNFWFGTNGDGVIRYNGESLDYLSLEDGFAGMAVRGIVEDEEGNIWFGTEKGLSKYEPSHPGTFTNYDEKDGLVHHDIWSLCLDKEGIIWIGTYGGVSIFDGKTFTTFELPETAPDYSRGVTSSRIVHSIMEDSKGRMWFGTNGGAFIYDGKSLSNISTKEGLCHNAVNDILEDREGNFWFATHHNGVCRWDGKSFTHFDQKDGVEGTEVWSLFEDSKGNIWFPSEGYGIYRFNGESFERYHTIEGLSSHAIQCIFEDSKGRIWCGGHKGLYRLNLDGFIAVGQNGPWQEGC